MAHSDTAARHGGAGAGPAQGGAHSRPVGLTGAAPLAVVVALGAGPQVDAARGVLAEGARLARELDLGWRAVGFAPAPGEEELLDLGSYGVPEVLAFRAPALADLPEERAAALVSVLAAGDTRLVLLAHDDVGGLLAPLLAARLGAALLTEVLSVEPALPSPGAAAPSTGCALPAGEAMRQEDPGSARARAAGLVIRRAALRGRLVEERFWDGRSPLVLTLAPETLSPVPPPGVASSPPERISLPVEAGGGSRGLRVLERIPADPETVDLSEAEVLFCAGKGCDPASFAGLAELASLLGASLGVTRPVYDLGWAEFERLIGQTGRTVAPRLYLAVGVSGSPHHVGGIKDSGRIVSLNLDVKAPIFATSDQGFIGDAAEVLPLLLAKVKAALAQAGALHAGESDPASSSAGPATGGGGP